MTTRAAFIGGTTALVVAIGNDGVRSFAHAADAPPKKLSPLSNWLRMLPDGTVEMYSDKVEVGMGVATGFAQFVADELSVPLDRVRPMLGDTSNTEQAGGVSGSFSTWHGNLPVRHAAAQMRAILLAAAAKQLGVPVAQLTVKNGVVAVTGDATKTLPYTSILGALQPDPSFPLTGDGGPFTDITVTAEPKDWSAYRIAGSSFPRKDAPAKAFGRYPYVVDVKLSGMLHGRFIYPPAVGATLAGVDESSIHGFGDARIVRTGGFAGIVATREWDAIRAVRALKATWSSPSMKLPGTAGLAAYMWAQTPMKQAIENTGNVDIAIGSAPIEATYSWPFQSHANMGPGCTVADVRDGGVTVWSGTQKTHTMRQGVAALAGVPLERARVIWVSDAGSYGRGGLEETAGAAVLLSKAAGRPVRVQQMRGDNTQWGPKAPAFVGRMRGNLKDGKIVALDATLRQFNGNEIYAQPNTAGNFMAGQMAGFANTDVQYEYAQYGRNSTTYAIPNTRSKAELLAPFAPLNSPLRTSHMRDPEGPGTTFIVESFVDELAAHAGEDAFAFRIKHINDPRQLKVFAAAAQAFGWDTRPSASRKQRAANGDSIGRGVAFSNRGATIVATMVEAAVNPQTGAVRVRRIVCAHDCGFIVNPKSLQGTIEANLIQSISRAIYEQATFDERTVTSADWITYPIAHMHDVPDVVQVVMIDQPSIAPGGAGEPSSRPTAAAIANAIFDATGARVRTAPFTPANVLAAMRA